MAVDVGRTGIWCMSRIWPASPGAAADAAAELEELGYQALWLGISAASLELPQALLAATSSLAVATGIVSVWDAPPADMAAACHRVAGEFPGRFLLGLGASHAHVVARGGQEYRRPYSKMASFLDGLDAATPPVPLLAPEQKVILSTDPAQARRIARSALCMYLKAPNYIASLLRLGFTEDDIGQASDHLIDALVAWGDEDAIAARVSDHRQAGADHVCVQVLTGETNAKVLAGEPALPRCQWRELAPALT